MTVLLNRLFQDLSLQMVWVRVPMGQNTHQERGLNQSMATLMDTERSLRAHIHAGSTGYAGFFVNHSMSP